MKELHSKQRQILDLLRENCDNPLSVKDLSNAVNIKSPGVLYHHLNQLEKRGYLKKNPQNSKDYIVLDSPEKSVVYLGKFGKAQCGSEGILLDEAPEEHIPIASSLLRFPASEAFIVEAEGDSMEPKIHAGDIVIAKRQRVANSGDVVVCTLNEQVKIKRLVSANGLVSLYSLNDRKYDPQPFTPDDSFFIAGVVMTVLSYHLR